MKEIHASMIKGIQIGQAQDETNGTGCTVILCKNGATAGVDVRGGGPATRETDLLNPKNMVQQIHAVMLSGGSAFGLDACSGAMRYLEEQGCGFEIADQHVPIVCGASLFDLCVGNGKIRPDAAMGYAACAASEHNTFTDGNYGAGTGASVGKLIGANHAMKSGQGMYGVQCGKLQVCAVVAVNACGNVRDVDTRQYLAGVYREGKIMDPLQLMEEMAEIRQELPHGNTTIGCIITNAVLNKSQCNKISSIAHNGYADAIFPVHTMSDGDTIFTLATQEVAALPDTVGALAVYAMGKAINRAVLASQDAYGLKAASSIRRILDERQ